MRIRALLLAALVAATLVAVGEAPATAVATTFTVTGTDDPSPTPACAGSVCPSLRAAVAAANATSGSTIELGNGTFLLAQGQLELTSPVTIGGAGQGSTTIEQTGSNDRVIENGSSGQNPGTAPGVVIHDLTVTGGHVAPQPLFGQPGTSGGEGGAIFTAGDLTLDHVVLTGNTVIGPTDQTPAATAGQDGGMAIGGAISAWGGDLLIVSSTISDNITQGGAGQPGPTSGAGGASFGTVSASWGTVTVVDTTFDDNTSVGGPAGQVTSPDGVAGAGGNALGGALRIGGPLTIRGSTFVDNRATAGDGSADPSPTNGARGQALGGAILATSGPTRVVDSTFTGNSASAVADGVAQGGGILADGDVVIGSTTLSGNAVDGSVASGGGNLALTNYGGGPAGTTISGSVLENGESSGPAGNCLFTDGGTVTSGGHNLEDDAPSQCGLDAPSDLIGVDPVLGPLADNGGPTQTMLPSATSPVIAAGGACADPTTDPAAPLTVDQRGEPRPSGRPCDIGAVQLPVPFSTVPPSISPVRPLLDQIATCHPGTFVGGSPLTYAYSWTRDGVSVGGTTIGYTVGTGDVGHRLRCTVVAHGSGYASQPATSAFVVPAAPPVISGVGQSHPVWRRHLRPRGAGPVGTTYRLRLSKASTVTIAFTQLDHAGILRGRLVRSLPTGASAIAFAGRLSTGRFLPPGRYRATFSASSSDGTVSQPVSLSFRIAA